MCIRDREFGDIKIAALPTTTSIIAAIMVQEYIKILFGLEHFKKTGKWPQEFGQPLAGKRLFFNGLHNIFVVVDVPIDPSCELHME